MTIPTAARRVAALFVALAPVLLAGCGASTGNVSGTVTLNGNPVNHAVVSFVSPDGAIQSAITDASGKYTLEGVKAGPNQVTVRTDEGGEETRTVKKLGGPKQAVAAAAAAGRTLVPAKYAETTTSGLTLTVKSGQNTYDIPLTP